MTDDTEIPPPPEDHSMEIHKPHATKTWKEFFIELGTVVLGILIALSLEQAVERWREHRQYGEGRQAMLDELSANLTNIRQRDRYAACTVKRLDDIDALLDRAESGQTFDAPSWIGSVVTYRMRFVAENEVQKSALFSSAEQRNFGSPYSYFHSIEAEQDRERQAWGRLQMLRGKNRLSQDMIQSARNALADARFENDRIAFLMAWAEAFGKQIDLKDLSNAPYYADDHFHKHPNCEPMNTPFAVAERETAVNPPSDLKIASP
jgi:hypothetical protein